MKKQLKYLTAALMFASAITVTAMDGEEAKKRVTSQWENTVKAQMKEHDISKEHAIKRVGTLDQALKQLKSGNLFTPDDEIDPGAVQHLDEQFKQFVEMLKNPQLAKAFGSKKVDYAKLLGLDAPDLSEVESVKKELLLAKHELEQEKLKVGSDGAIYTQEKFDQDLEKNLVGLNKALDKARDQIEVLEEEISKAPKPEHVKKAQEDLVAEQQKLVEANKKLQELTDKLNALHDDGETVKSSEHKAIVQELEEAKRARDEHKLKLEELAKTHIAIVDSELKVKAVQEQHNLLHAKVVGLEEEVAKAKNPFYAKLKSLDKPKEELATAIELVEQQLVDAPIKSREARDPLKVKAGTIQKIMVQKELDEIFAAVPELKAKASKNGDKKAKLQDDQKLVTEYIIQNGIELGDQESSTLVANVIAFAEYDVKEQERFTQLQLKVKNEKAKLIQDFVDKLDLESTKAYMSDDASGLIGKATEEVGDNRDVIAAHLNHIFTK